MLTKISLHLFTGRYAVLVQKQKELEMLVWLDVVKRAVRLR